MKFEITISKATLKKIKRIWVDQDFEPESDEEAIKELFFVETDPRYSYVDTDFRDKVKVKKVED